MTTLMWVFGLVALATISGLFWFGAQLTALWRQTIEDRSRELAKREEWTRRVIDDTLAAQEGLLSSQQTAFLRTIDGAMNPVALNGRLGAIAQQEGSRVVARAADRVADSLTKRRDSRSLFSVQDTSSVPFPPPEDDQADRTGVYQ